MEPKTATPFVYWAQSQEQIFLRFELEAKSQPNVSTSESELSFSCDGTAPTTGHRRYCVVLSFHDDIVPGSSGYRMEVMGSKIQFYLEKAPEKQYFWPHLLKNRAKPAWYGLCVNFVCLFTKQLRIVVLVSVSVTPSLWLESRFRSGLVI